MSGSISTAHTDIVFHRLGTTDTSLSRTARRTIVTAADETEQKAADDRSQDEKVTTEDYHTDNDDGCGADTAFIVGVGLTLHEILRFNI